MSIKPRPLAVVVALIIGVAMLPVAVESGGALLALTADHAAYLMPGWFSWGRS